MRPSLALRMRPTARLLSSPSNSHTHGIISKLKGIKAHAPPESYPLFFACGFMLTVMVSTGLWKLRTDRNLRRGRHNRTGWDGWYEDKDN